MVLGGVDVMKVGQGGLWAMIERKLAGMPASAARPWESYSRDSTRRVNGKAGRYSWSASVSTTMTTRNTSCQGLQ